MVMVDQSESHMAVILRPCRGRRIAALWCGLVLTSFLVSCQGQSDAKAEVAEDPSILIGRENITVVQNITLRTGPTISGSLEAQREATVRAEVGGAILETFAEQGEPVQKGRLLARIDDTAIKDQLISARSAARSSQNALEVAKREEARSERLAQAGAIAERDLELAQHTRIDRESQLADAQARLVAAQQQFARTQIRAPFSGIVSERPANAGDIVQPGGALFTIVDPSSMRLEATVPAEQIAALRVGIPVDFTISGFAGRTFTGKIERINPAADPETRQVRIYVEIPNAGRSLVVGLFAEGRVALEAREGLGVPASAVDVRGTSPAVLRLRGARVERVPVKLGIRDDVAELVEIVSGVSAGDTLLLGSAQGLSEGTVVRVREATVNGD